jgi:hypothetical protein
MSAISDKILRHTFIYFTRSLSLWPKLRSILAKFVPAEYPVIRMTAAAEDPNLLNKWFFVALYNRRRNEYYWFSDWLSGNYINQSYYLAGLIILINSVKKYKDIQLRSKLKKINTINSWYTIFIIIYVVTFQITFALVSGSHASIHRAAQRGPYGERVCPLDGEL